MSTTWRPHPIIRPVAIGVVRRGDRLLIEGALTAAPGFAVSP
jgi:hypothetical protein